MFSQSDFFKDVVSQSDGLDKRYDAEKSKDSIVECDSCHCQFKVSEVNIRETVVESKSEQLWTKVTWFMCETCGKVYVIEVLTDEGRRLKREYLKACSNIKKHKSRKDIKSYEAKRKRLMKCLFEAKKVLGPVLASAIEDSEGNK